MAGLITSLKYSSYVSTSQAVSANATFKNPIDDDDIDVIKLKEDNILKIASEQHSKYYRKEFKKERNLFICNIRTTETDDSIVNSSQFIFKYNLWIPKRNYYYYEFKVSLQTIKKIDARITRDLTVNNIHYFPKNEYPNVKKDTINARVQNVRDEMIFEDKYSMKPKIPIIFALGGAKAKHAKSVLKYIQNLFTSIPLLLQDWLYIELKIPHKLSVYIQQMCKDKLDQYRNERRAMDGRYKSSDYLINQKDDDNFVFHTIYVARKPMDKLKQLSHWALKFEGKYLLMTIEFMKKNDEVYKSRKDIVFDKLREFNDAIKNGNNNNSNNNCNNNCNKPGIENEIKQDNDQKISNKSQNEQPMDIGKGIIKVKMLNQTRMNRRLFWYSWEDIGYHEDIIKKQGNDEVNNNELQNNETKSNKRDKQILIDGWEIIDKVFVNKMDAELIGLLCQGWLDKKQSKYIFLHNNCQHFCVDFMSIINPKLSKRLSSELSDGMLLMKPLPYNTLACAFKDNIRITKTAQYLKTIYQKYEKDKKMRHRLQEFSDIDIAISDDDEDYPQKYTNNVTRDRLHTTYD